MKKTQEGVKSESKKGVMQKENLKSNGLQGREGRNRHGVR